MIVDRIWELVLDLGWSYILIGRFVTGDFMIFWICYWMRCYFFELKIYCDVVVGIGYLHSWKFSILYIYVRRVFWAFRSPRLWDLWHIDMNGNLWVCELIWSYIWWVMTECIVRYLYSILFPTNSVRNLDFRVKCFSIVFKWKM